MGMGNMTLHKENHFYGFIMAISVILVIVATIGAGIWHSVATSLTHSTASATTGNNIIDENYAGWRGIEALGGSYGSYVSQIRQLIGVEALLHHDVYWPYEQVDDIFCELARREDLVVLVGRVLRVHSIEVTELTRISGEVIVKYDVIVERVVLNNPASIQSRPSDAVEREYEAAINILKYELEQGLIDQETYEKLLEKYRRGLEATLKYHELLRIAGESIRENAVVVLSVPAYVAIDSFNKVLEGEALSITDIASPFPLLNPGNTYVLFISPMGERSGVIIYDLVYGLYAFYVKDQRVYSLDRIAHPVSLDPVRFYEDSQEIYWWNNRPYRELRSIALARLLLSGEHLETIMIRILSCRTR